jgi:hypothetical protein
MNPISIESDFTIDGTEVRETKTGKVIDPKYITRHVDLKKMGFLIYATVYVTVNLPSEMPKGKKPSLPG